MKSVYTESQLKDALNEGCDTIVLYGEIANKVRKKYQTKKNVKRGGIALAIGGILAIPFTGGASLPAAVAGLTVGTVTISTAELAILVGGSLAIAGICKGYDVKFNSDGGVTLEKK